ncbi:MULTISPECIES: ABC transporter ATP-binding protein [Nocardiopsis]|uniref:ABC transporter n=1 Tax=Nocardiopsis sinuspersici TaxID=501010 RepID=A0A1V3C7Q8_9ACTN|nr:MULTISPECIES: ABC transporter ATP-binding protein [Nocardiopsis]OOC56672.1 ABC transporter [Nocardiopsis sinuspersici]
MSRYPSLWWEVLRLSWRTAPGLTAGAYAAVAVSVGAVAAVGLSLRATVDATAQGAAGAALLGAAGVAGAYALTLVLQDLTTELVGTVSDRTGRMAVHPRVHRDINAVQGLEHLERGDFLDRVSLVRRSTGSIARSGWNAVLAVASVLKLLVTVVLLGGVDPVLLVLIPLAAAPVWCDHRGQLLVQRAEVEGAEAHRVQQHLFDTLVGAAGGKEVRVAGAAERLLGIQARAWREAERVRFRARAFAALWTLAGWTVFVAGFTGGIALVVRLAAGGTGGVGDLVLTVMLAVSLRQTMQGTVATAAEATGMRRVIEPYLWLRDLVRAERERGAADEPPPEALSRGIALAGVSFTYPGTGRRALDDVSVLLPAGSVVAVVGEYGSGKTTLVKLLLSFYEPDSGCVLLDGRDLGRVRTAGWRARTSAVFQDFGRFHTVFRETVGIGDLPRMGDGEALREAVRAADAEALAERLPEGWETQLGRELGGTELSEGQWQRTALARASMRGDPLLFVLDEPTASLDAPSEEAIFRRYMERARAHAAVTGAVTVIVSHRFSTVAGADLVLVMDRGRIVESGTHGELLALDGRYSELYGMQARAYAPEPGG